MTDDLVAKAYRAAVQYKEQTGRKALRVGMSRPTYDALLASLSEPMLVHTDVTSPVARIWGMAVEIEDVPDGEFRIYG